MLIGYARVSTSDQDTAAQVAALQAAGCSTLAGAGSRFLWPPGVGDDDLLAVAVQDSRYGGGPGLAVSRLHDDVRTDELRG